LIQLSKSIIKDIRSDSIEKAHQLDERPRSEIPGWNNSMHPEKDRAALTN
jgi:hypothetical protein